MKVLITGAHGLVGRHLAEHYRGHAVTVLGHGDLDIGHREDVLAGIDRHKPDVIFNCAVIGVDDCERDPAAARSVNVDGPANLADAARQTGATIVHFSTNYVFDGTREVFYTTEDEPHAVNVYGATKAEGERAVRDRCPQSFVIRTSWVFGRGKQSFLATVGDRLRKGERVSAIDDVWASTTYVRDLVPRVAEIVGLGQYGIYHVVNSGVCSYLDFAREAARLTGSDPSLIDVAHEAQMMRSKRPRYTPMRCVESERVGLSPLREWKNALSAYLNHRGTEG